jgi:hypothetical protein
MLRRTQKAALATMLVGLIGLATAGSALANATTFGYTLVASNGYHCYITGNANSDYYYVANPVPLSTIHFGGGATCEPAAPINWDYEFVTVVDTDYVGYQEQGVNSFASDRGLTPLGPSSKAQGCGSGFGGDPTWCTSDAYFNGGISGHVYNVRGNFVFSLYPGYTWTSYPSFCTPERQYVGRVDCPGYINSGAQTFTTITAYNGP